MIDVRVMRWTLFGILFLTWPLPLLGLEGTLVPVARFLQLAMWLTILIVLEGAGGMVGGFSVLLWGHVLVYGVVLFAVASIFVRQVHSRLPCRVAMWVIGTTVVALVSWASFAGPYDSAFHHSNAHASLLDLYR